MRKEYLGGSYIDLDETIGDEEIIPETPEEHEKLCPRHKIKLEFEWIHDDPKLPKGCSFRFNGSANAGELLQALEYTIIHVKNSLVKAESR